VDERNHSSLPIENDKTTNLKSIPADPPAPDRASDFVSVPGQVRITQCEQMFPVFAWKQTLTASLRPR
jgi:hypothetical protein